MKIGICLPAAMAHSGRVYTENVMRELTHLGIRTIQIPIEAHIPPDIELLWAPVTGGLFPPRNEFKITSEPRVITFHGAASMSLPWHEHYETFRSAIHGKLKTIYYRRIWQLFRGRCAAIIAISEYGKREIESRVGLQDELIFPIHHGVDQTLFRPSELTRASDGPYLLHVSHYQPLKNIRRVFQAYNRLRLETRPRLIAVVPNYPDRPAPEGVELIRNPIPQEELVDLYRSAEGFLFPSLRETFGMPILEAMASGCPVITSNDTGCAEIAGDAALLVDPRSVEAIRAAMQSLIEHEKLRANLRAKGLARAAEFTWEKSARKHLDVFEKAIRGRTFA